MWCRPFIASCIPKCNPSRAVPPPVNPVREAPSQSTHLRSIPPCLTYQEFRTWALAHGYAGRTLAQHPQAGDPLKTATRILVFLAGTHWDRVPLPYPKLCHLHAHGHATSEAAKPPCIPHPLPIRQVSKLSETKEAALAFRQHIRDTSYTIPQLTRMLFWYADDVVTKIVDEKPRPSRSTITPGAPCPCGCERRLTGRQRFSTDACRMKVHRRAVRFRGTHGRFGRSSRVQAAS
jgi:hypothetical protein